MSDNLVIASKLKKHLKDVHGLRSSEDCLPALSAIVEAECAKAVARCLAERRKTVQGKDFVQPAPVPENSDLPQE